MLTLSFKPKQTTRKVLGALGDRAYDVLSSRFGLEGDEPKTLEAIGKNYRITRERVRQIENAALNTLRKSETFAAEEAAFEELKNLINSLGGVVAAESFLQGLAKDKETQNHIHFHLTLCPHFFFREEDDNFKDRWATDDGLARAVEDNLVKFHSSLGDDNVMTEDEIVQNILSYLKNIPAECRKPEVARQFLNLSKHLGCNRLGEWGKLESPHIRLKGIKDYAYLILRRHGSPLHFRDVAKSIGETFERKTNSATCHNELIKDKRFVIVGRGMYGLSEWGYKPGIVREVIYDILKDEGPMDKDEIIDRVLKERFLKRNTIIVNLQNPRYFRKNRDDLYTIA